MISKRCHFNSVLLNLFQEIVPALSIKWKGTVFKSALFWTGPCFLFRPFEKWGENLYSGVFKFFCFQAKSGNTNNHRAGLSDISYYNPFKHVSNHIIIFPSVDCLKFLIFRFNSSK